MQETSIRWIAVLLSFLLFGATGCRSYKHISMAPPIPPPAGMLEAAVSSSQTGEGTKVAETGNLEQTTNATDRLIMYDATLHVVVPDAGSALSAIRTMATALGGYMQSLTGNAIVLRIPEPRLNDAIRQVEQMGEIAFRQITGTDVTEEMLDLDIRLKNM